MRKLPCPLDFLEEVALDSEQPIFYFLYFVFYLFIFNIFFTEII
jgi:hypothetical protein